MTRYLSIGTYPRFPCLQGGRLRLEAMHRTLAAHGWTTRHLWIGPALDEGDTSGDVALNYSRSFNRLIDEEGRRPDVAAERWLREDLTAWNRFATAVIDFDPDVIAIEQAMAWPAVHRLLESTGLRSSVSLIYSAHNVERALLAAEARIPGSRTSLADVREVELIEAGLAAEADLVIAVSDPDAAEFRNWNSNTVVAGNGIWPRPAKVGHGGGLFVGSAHPPNSAGFLALCRDWLSRAGGAPLTVAGGVCHALQGPLAEAVRTGRLILIGQVDQARLDQVIDAASFIVLPILDGGGTNIKTAEALASGKPIVATTLALRGYESFLDLAGIHIADEPAGFGAALDRLSRGVAAPPRSAADKARLAQLAWPARLASLPEWAGRVNRFGWSPPPVGAERAGRVWFRRGAGWATDALGRPQQIAPVAELHWPAKASARGLRLHLSAMADANKPQQVTVTVDGAVIADLRFTGFAQQHAVDIPSAGDSDPGQIAAAGRAPARIAIACTPLRSPLDIGLGPDRRRVGALIGAVEDLG